MGPSRCPRCGDTRGLDRDQPVDRHYIEAFLARHAEDIHGRVLECADPRYTRQIGGARVTHSEVLHPVPGSPRATRVGRLETGEGVPSESFDCIVLTQVLQYVFELDAAVATLHRALAPGGVLLLPVPATSKLSGPDDAGWCEHWRFTARSVRRLLEAHVPREQLAVEAHGNVLACVAFLQGLATEELSAEQDPEFRRGPYADHTHPFSRTRVRSAHSPLCRPRSAKARSGSGLSCLRNSRSLGPVREECPCTSRELEKKLQSTPCPRSPPRPTPPPASPSPSRARRTASRPTLRRDS
jgi:SAM-dependent methyltransferase